MNLAEPRVLGRLAEKHGTILTHRYSSMIDGPFRRISKFIFIRIHVLEWWDERGLPQGPSLAG
jgi:hypothetical protein